MGSGQSGFTLIESMVAMAILATGLLALAAMQSISLTRNVDSTELTRATNLAADIIERVQNNRQNVGQYAIDTSNGTPCPQSPVTQPMAKGDCDQWVQLLANPQASGLANVRGVIVVPPTPAGTLNTLLNAYPVTVTISWTGAAGETKVARPKQVTLTTTVSPE
ncbi:MAG TPA: type IV pilus modification protein PilV, partial [Nitrospira sp.]